VALLEGWSLLKGDRILLCQATIVGRNLIFGHKLHIGMLYCGKRFWTRQIPTSCLPVFIHIEHICGGIIPPPSGGVGV
jgi:hypothetical protein